MTFAESIEHMFASKVFANVRSVTDFNDLNHDISYADTRVGDYVR